VKGRIPSEFNVKRNQGNRNYWDKITFTPSKSIFSAVIEVLRVIAFSLNYFPSKTDLPDSATGKTYNL
jgi:hypothetical protein